MGYDEPEILLKQKPPYVPHSLTGNIFGFFKGVRPAAFRRDRLRAKDNAKTRKRFVSAIFCHAADVLKFPLNRR